MGTQSNKLPDLETKSIKVTAHGFKQAFDVALSSNSNLGVTGFQAYKIFILQLEQNGTYKARNAVLGTGDVVHPMNNSEMLFKNDIVHEKYNSLTPYNKLEKECYYC